MGGQWGMKQMSEVNLTKAFQTNYKDKNPFYGFDQFFIRDMLYSKHLNKLVVYTTHIKFPNENSAHYWSYSVSIKRNRIKPAKSPVWIF